jgi:hypothetical protein
MSKRGRGGGRRLHVRTMQKTAGHTGQGKGRGEGGRKEQKRHNINSMKANDNTGEESIAGALSRTPRRSSLLLEPEVLFL